MNIITISILLVLSYTIAKSLFLKGGSNWSSYSRGTTSYLNPYVAALSIFASLNGGFMVFGLVQVGFEGGLSGYIWGLTYLIGIPLLIFILKKAKERSNSSEGIFGIDVMLYKVYGKQTLLAFYFFTAFVFSGVLGGQLLSISFFLKKFDDLFTMVTVLVVGLIGTAIYTIKHGFKGVISNDIVQSILEFLVSVIFPLSVIIFLKKTGGIAFDLKGETLGGSYGSIYPVAGAIFLLLSFSSRADLWQRISIVNEKYHTRVLVISSSLLALYYFSMTTAGIIIKQNIDRLSLPNNFNRSELVILLAPDMINGISHGVISQVLQILCLSGILIAIFSSVDSYLNLTSLSLTKFLLWKTVPKADQNELTPDENQVLLVNARICTIVVSIIAGVMATLLPNILDLMSASFSVLGILVPIVIYGALSKKKHKDLTGALSLWISFLTLLVCLPYLKKFAFIPSFTIGILSFLILLYKEYKSFRTLQDRSITNAQQ